MAEVGLFDDDEEERRRRAALSTPEPSGSEPRPPIGEGQYSITDPPVTQPPPSSPDPVADMISRDQSSWEQQLRQGASQYGLAYSPEDLQGVIRNLHNYESNPQRNMDPAAMINTIMQQYQSRANNTPNSESGQTGGSTDRQQATSRMGWSGGGSFNRAATMFDDPGTTQLEKLLNAQMEALNKPNPQLTQLMDFLNKQFAELSANPGYSPEELALQRTQSFEPLEAYRHASKQRATERAGARGMLPTSGLHELDLRDIDMSADRNRSALDRDLAIRGMDERKGDLARALQMAQSAFEIPVADERARFGDQLTRSSMLYELPRNALRDSLSVLGATPGPESLFNQSVQLQQMQQQRDFLNQQRNAQMFNSIGSIIPSIMGLFD